MSWEPLVGEAIVRSKRREGGRGSIDGGGSVGDSDSGGGGGKKSR